MTEMDSPTSPALPTNRAANVAIAAGLLSIIPGVGLVAIVAGLIAGNKSRVSGGAGRGRAFFAVVLGIGSLFIWAMLIGALLEGRARQRAVPAVNATKKFIMLVGSGNVRDAKALTTDAIDIDKLTDTAEQFAQWGTFTGDIAAYAGKPLPHVDGVQVEYRLPFEKTVQIFSGDWVFIDGQPRLTAYTLRPEEVETTQPAKK
ncbi:MAG: hypothetical protein JWM57_609 [Phycisphaerales bacterium]|nr:hypothetical protein [Phycisphaerales bacterium]